MSPANGDHISRQAREALRQHAEMFEALGMRSIRELENSLLLEDEDLSVLLEYGMQRRLLSRIYTLRLNMEVASDTPSAASPYRLTLKTSGLARASHTLIATGPAAKEARMAADLVMTSGVLDELAKKVDLEKLSISWSPETETWRVVLEPYPGGHIHVLLPTIRYTVRLKEPEVIAIRAFLISLSGVLKRSDL